MTVIIGGDGLLVSRNRRLEREAEEGEQARAPSHCNQIAVPCSTLTRALA
jgi:hypothetical protein